MIGTRTPSAQNVKAFETTCGPWYPSDDPRDIVLDIKAVDPLADVTVSDAALYLEGCAR